jgi:hypothetical protein
VTKEQGKQKQNLRAARAKKVRVRQSIWIGGTEEAAEQLREAEGRRLRQQNIVDVRGSDATDADRHLLEEIEQEVQAVKTKAREESIFFLFESIGRKRYDKMMEEHPPSKEQVIRAEKEGETLTFNVETFPFALIDACALEPEHEPGELGAWLQEDPDDEWNTAEIADLFQAAMTTNVGRVRLDLGKD